MTIIRILLFQEDTASRIRILILIGGDRVNMYGSIAGGINKNI
jgi:hypothetical protein